MLAVAIKDLEMRMSNSNLLLEKNAIWFEPSAQKRETGKQTAGTLYYQYEKSVSQEHMLIWGKPGPKPPSASKSNCYSFSETSTQVGSWGDKGDI